MMRFFDLQPESLGQWCAAQGMPTYAPAQIMDWVYRKGVTDPAEMSNLSRRHRESLAQSLEFLDSSVVEQQAATDGTRKLLLEWGADSDAPSAGAEITAGEPEGNATSLPLLSPVRRSGRRTECVMIPTSVRRTACVSSQVGCPVGCAFCASGIGGLEGNLSAGQIVEQVHKLNWLPGERGQPPERMTNVVFMGMGEPLANLANVTAAIRTLNAPWGMGIGARRITVSTVGLPGAIRKLVQFEIPVTLALSLHAPNDHLRRQLIPWANHASIDELLDSCNEYFQKTGREITLEYILLRDVNDQLEHARELADVARRLRANVNLIRYNEVKGIAFNRPRTTDVLAFQAELRRRRVNTHIRASRGRDIAAACGQLRHERADRSAAAQA